MNDEQWKRIARAKRVEEAAIQIMAARVSNPKIVAPSKKRNPDLPNVGPAFARDQAKRAIVYAEALITELDKL